MPDWVTILVALLVGLFGGVIGTLIAARHDSRMRLRDLTAEKYSQALAAAEEIFHLTYSRYGELRTRPVSEPADESIIRREVDEIRSKTASMQAPAKLLGPAEVEEALHDFDTILAQKLVPAIRTGHVDEVRKELDGIHDRLLEEMQKHLRTLG